MNDAPVLTWNRKEVISDFAERCNRIGADTDSVMRHFDAFERYYRSPKTERLHDDAMILQKRWYDSVTGGHPDLSVYCEQIYLADLLACYLIYSRKYLLQLRKKFNLMQYRTVDLGCGLGYTTAVLNEMSANDVFGTYFSESWQSRFAETVAEDCGFTLNNDLSSINSVDFVFASEYFEHFEQPVAHLCEEIFPLNFKLMLVANAFNADSCGHFNRGYVVNLQPVTSRAIGRKFNEHMRMHGYERIETGWWNDRPAVWKQEQTDLYARR